MDHEFATGVGQDALKTLVVAGKTSRRPSSAEAAPTGTPVVPSGSSLPWSDYTRYPCSASKNRNMALDCLCMRSVASHNAATVSCDEFKGLNDGLPVGRACERHPDSLFVNDSGRPWRPSSRPTHVRLVLRVLIAELS